MTEYAEVRTRLQNALGPDVGIGITDPRAETNSLFPEEEPAMARAVEKRRKEFAAGRTAARLAMQDLGIEPTAVPMAADRSPVWPAGLIGSVTHCDDLCIAVVSHKGARTGIGIDVELAEPLGTDNETVICTQIEREWLQTQSIETRGLRAKEIFCAKESVYKALYPSIRRVLGFDEVELELPIGGDVFLVSANRRKLSIQVDLVTVTNKIIVVSCLSALAT